MFERTVNGSQLFSAAVRAAREKNPDLDRAALHDIAEATDAERQIEERPEVRRVFGEAAGLTLERYQTTLPMRHVTTDLATELFYSDVPLLPAQGEQLIDLLTANARAPGGRIEIAAIDVETVVARAQGILSAAQLTEMRRVVLRLQEYARQEQERVTAPLPKKSSGG